MIRTGNLEGQKLNLSEVKYVTREFHQKNRKSRVSAGDILIARHGSSGQAVVVPGDIEDANSLNIVIIQIDRKQADYNFVAYMINSPVIRKQVLEATAGSTQGVINTASIAKLSLKLPRLPEQKSIAEVLIDVDGNISALEKLIAKKRDIKQATMQQLLTGKTRPPGFSGDWQIKKLFEVSWYQEGPGVRAYQFTNRGIKLLNGTNIFKGKLNLENTQRFISHDLAQGQYKHFLADEGDIVIASSGISIDRFDEKVATVGKQDLPMCMNTSTIRFKANSQMLKSDYLFHFLTGPTFKAQIGKMATGSAQLNFGPSHLNKVEIGLPPIPEQLEVSGILTALDNENRLLEQKLEKLKLLKQGMMQELLTGRIRLI